MSFKKSLVTLIALAVSVHSFGGSILGAEQDPNLKTFITNTKRLPDPVYQSQLIQTAAWMHFSANHSKWAVVFNEENQKPHQAFGSPIAVTPGADAKSTALNFIQNSLREFNIPVSELKFQNSNSSKYQNVFFTQEHNGLEVLFSRFSVKMTNDNKVISWSADVFDNMQVDMVPSVDAASAKNLAVQNIPSVTNISDAVLKILPVPAYHKYDFHLVYELTVSASVSGSPAVYYTLVDARTGEVLYRQNKISFAAPLSSDVEVKGTVYKSGLTSLSSQEPLKNLKVVTGGNTLYTDHDGEVSFSLSSSQSAVFSLEGQWSKVVTDQGTASPAFTQTVGVGNSTVCFDSTTTVRHLSGYYHVNVVHNFMKQFFPAFTVLDTALTTRIDVTGSSCNAFYNNSSVNFYATGGGCQCMSQLGDIVYHEYGHGISNLFYQSMGSSWDNGSMGEGYSDIWGISITQNPVFGQGYITGNTNSYIRRYDYNKKVYPQDLTGEIHANGEIIAGAWYDVSLNMGSWWDMTDLFTDTYFDLLTAPDGSEGQLYQDILLSALQHDDNDGDLSNGTPHLKAILDAFALHGITLSNVVDLSHKEILSATSATPIHVSADLVNSLPFLGPNYVNLYYKTSSTGSWNKIPMSTTSATTYSADIPAQSSGTLISYYMELLDSNQALIKTLPAEVNTSDPNIPYFILVDYNSVLLENFEGATTGWKEGITGDNASYGIWTIDTPVPSYNGTALCQPDIQHSPGGSKCAITGNANPGDPIEANDVFGGTTTLQSPVYNLAAYNKPAVSFWRWYTNDQGFTQRAESWKVYASSNGVNYTPIEVIDVPDHSYRRFVFRVADVLPGAKQITLRFVAENSVSGSVVEASVDDVEILELNKTVGISENSEINNISVYPNPSKDQLNISMPSLKEKAELRIVSPIGATVYSETIAPCAVSSVKNISVKDLAACIYVVSLQSSEGIARLNIIVQH